MKEYNKSSKVLNKNKIRSSVTIGGEIFLIVGLGITFLYFCYLIRDVVNPIIVFVVLLCGLIPFRRFMWAKTLIILLSFLFSLWVIDKASYLMAPFIIGGLIAYLFNPFITSLEKRIPRVILVILIFIPLAGLAFVLFLILVPRFMEETLMILDNLTSQTSNIATTMSMIFNEVTGWIKNTIPGFSNIDFYLDENIIMDFLFDAGGILDDLYTYITSIKITNITTVFSMVFSYFVILPFVTFYFMLDFEKIENKLTKLIPLRWQDNCNYMIVVSNRIINNYIVGMSILALVFFVLTYILLTITKTEYVLSLSFMRGVFNFIPFIGPFVAFLVALLVAMATDAVWWHGIIKMILVYGVIQIIDSGFLAPKILGRSVKIHAIAVMFATIIGGVLFGFVGVLIGIPLVGIILIIFNKISPYYYNSKFYNSTGKKK